MGIKRFRPVTPSLRFRTVASFEEITSSVPEASLLTPLGDTASEASLVSRVPATEAAIRTPARSSFPAGDTTNVCSDELPSLAVFCIMY